MKRSLKYNPGSLLGEMRKKIVEKEEKKDKAEKKKEVVEIDDTVAEEDRRLDMDEEPLDRKRKRESAAVGVDPFDDNVTLRFPAGASIIQELGTYMKEVKKLLLKEDKQYLERMKLSQFQERTLAHLIEAAQATMICNDLVKSEANRAKTAERKIEKLRVEHGEREKNLEERIGSLKKKADEYDELYSSKQSLEVLLAAVRNENENLKAEREKLREERDELDVTMVDAQMIGGLAMQKFLMKEFLEHRRDDWDPEEKIKEINEVLAEEGIKTSDDEGEEKGEEKGEDEDGERMDEDAIMPTVGDDEDQDI